MAASTCEFLVNISDDGFTRYLCPAVVALGSNYCPMHARLLATRPPRVPVEWSATARDADVLPWDDADRDAFYKTAMAPERARTARVWP